MFGKTEKNKEMQNAWFYKQELVDKSYKTETKDLFLNEWQSQIENNTSCYNYRPFKRKFCFEKYLVNRPNLESI